MSTINDVFCCKKQRMWTTGIIELVNILLPIRQKKGGSRRRPDNPRN